MITEDFILSMIGNIQQTLILIKHNMSDSCNFTGSDSPVCRTGYVTIRVLIEKKKLFFVRLIIANNQIIIDYIRP